jgi:hypothetical protein
VALAEPTTAFYWTSNATIARELGVELDAEFGVALLRRYVGHPPAVAVFSSNTTSGGSENNANLLDQLETFFTAQKLPDYIRYEDAREDSGRLLLSVPIPYHMYVLGPASKLNDATTIAALRGAAAQLRGNIGLLTSDIADKDDSGLNTVADLFNIDENSVELFVSYLKIMGYRLIKLPEPP